MADLSRVKTWADLNTGQIFNDIITNAEYRALDCIDQQRYKIITNDTRGKRVIWGLVKTKGLVYLAPTPTQGSAALRLPDLSRLSLRAAPAPTDGCMFGQGYTNRELRIQFNYKERGSALSIKAPHRLIFVPCGTEGCNGYTYSGRAYDSYFYDVGIMKKRTDTEKSFYDYETDVWKEETYLTVQDIVKQLKDSIGKDNSLWRRYNGSSSPLGTLSGVCAYMWTEVKDPNGRREHLIYHQEF
ncbi:MAG: hypothetical protein CMM02_03880 [Rhodopirellula sp.]|nr:hypothetical protein [Rhodopirellula sp.]